MEVVVVVVVLIVVVVVVVVIVVVVVVVVVVAVVAVVAFVFDTKFNNAFLATSSEHELATPMPGHLGVRLPATPAPPGALEHLQL